MLRGRCWNSVETGELEAICKIAYRIWHYIMTFSPHQISSKGKISLGEVFISNCYFIYHWPAKTVTIPKIENWVITTITVYKDNFKTNPWTFFVVVSK